MTEELYGILAWPQAPKGVTGRDLSGAAADALLTRLPGRTSA